MQAVKNFIVLILLLSASLPAWSEPYLAIRSGLKCMVCHTNPTGGGQRNVFGNHYAQNTLAKKYIDFLDGNDKSNPSSDSRWNGQINRYISIGGDYRGQLTDSNTNSQSEFQYKTSQAYLALHPIPGRLTLYWDEKLGPGNTFNRETYALFWFDSQRYYIKAGRFFLPFGLRLQDDEAFTRGITGINFNTADDGIELGIELGPWSSHLAISNGSGIGEENNSDKQFSWNTTYAKHNWRTGISLNTNDVLGNQRDMIGIYAGLQTGPISWLFEHDRIEDTLPFSNQTFTQKIWLTEANWLISKGHNLKVTIEAWDPNTDIDDNLRERYSLVWEYFPIQYVQLSTGIRNFSIKTPPNRPASPDRDTAFLQLHLFF